MGDDYKIQHILPILLEVDSKVEHDNEWRKYREKNSRSEKQRGQALSMIKDQCMKVLLDNIKHDTDWGNTIK